MNYNELANYFVNGSVHFQQVFIYNMPANGQTIESAYICETTGFIIPLKGKVSLAVEGIPYCLEPGIVLHIGKGMTITKKVMTKDPAQIAVVYFRSQQAEALTNQQFKIDVDNDQEIIRTIQMLKQYYEQPAIIASLKCQVLFYTLLEQLVEGMRQGSETDDYMEDVLNYIHRNYRQPLSVTEIANKFDIERRHLAYIFKRYTGMSPLNYLTEYRIRLAKELLRHNEHPIMKVAELVGFEDNLYFSRIFKKRTGHSPSVYRESFIGLLPLI